MEATTEKRTKRNTYGGPSTSNSKASSSLSANKRSSKSRFSITSLNFKSSSSSSSAPSSRSLSLHLTPSSQHQGHHQLAESSCPASSPANSRCPSPSLSPTPTLAPFAPHTPHTPTPTSTPALSPSTSTSTSTSSSSSPLHAIATPSHSPVAHAKPNHNNRPHHRRDYNYNDRHFQPFRSPAAHSAHTIEASSALKPVIPVPSPSERNTVATSIASTTSATSSSFSNPSAPNSSSSSPTSTAATSISSTTTTRTAPSAPASPSRSSVRATFHRQAAKSTSRRPPPSSSSAQRQTPSLPVLSVVPPPGEDRGDGEARRPAMQRVSSFLPSWDKRTSTSSSSPRPPFFGWSNRTSTGNGALPPPSTLAKINTAAANANSRISLGGSRMQREAFWPATLDLECEKAARILKSFSTDGYLAPTDEDDRPQSADSQSPQQVSKKIPRRIIQNAAGIAIFTCMRSGLWMTGSGGSGILIARKSDGTWSPPSGIMLHTPTLSFIMGVDIYDCVLIVNNLAALESITRPRVTLGEDVGLTGGPLVTLDSDEAHIRWKDLGNTVLTYMKARGQSQLVNLNGCILAERGNENERFYSCSVSQMDILAGNVSRNVEETTPLFEVIKMAEGRSDYDATVINRIAFEPAPGDAVIATPKTSTPASPRNAFGIPNQDDPDPFGVLALEMAGLEIREAGSRLRPTSSQFDFNPAPTSPAFSKFSRQSMENFPKSNRASFMSSRTVKSLMTDAGTQTDVGTTPETTPSPSRSENSYGRTSPTQIPEVTEEEEEVDYTKVDMTSLKHLSTPPPPVEVTSRRSTSQGTTTAQDTLKVAEPRDDTDRTSSIYEMDEDESDDELDSKSGRDADDEDDLDDLDDSDDSEEEDEEEPVVFEVAAVQPARTVASRVIHAKGAVVTIPKRVPPPLPMRSPARTSRSSKTEIGDVSHLKSPLRQEFAESDADEEQTKTESSPYLKPAEVKLAPATPEKKRESASSVSSVSSMSELESETAETSPKDAPTTKDAETKPVQVEVPSTPTTTEPKDVESLDVPQLAHSDSSDSLEKKRTSSIYTGATENRWSMDGTVLTTPTSDRPFSVIDDAVEDETPRKPKETEQIELNEKYEELEKMGSKEATPNTITVA